jgi:transcriptional regulator with XRE-family HTH domain
MDPLAHRLRERRTALSLSYRKLAAMAGLQSPSFVYHVENGHKFPSEEVAARLARALGEDEELYRAWSRVRRRGDLDSTLAAARRLLREDLGGGVAAENGTAPSAPAPVAAPAPEFPVQRTEAAASGGPRLKVPVVPAGADPGDALRPSCPVVGHVRVDAAMVAEPERLIRPYAVPMFGAFARRVPDLGVGHLALIARDPRPPRPGEVWAVRAGGRVSLSRVVWNGAALLLQPAPGSSDFEVIPAQGDDGVRARLAGRLAAALDAGAFEPA